MRRRQETKDYQGLKHDVDGFARLLSPKVLRNFFMHGVLVYPVLSVLVYRVDTIASLAKSIVFQIKPRNKHFSTQHHMRHGLQDLQWIDMDLSFFYPCSRNLSWWKRRHSGTWHWEPRAEQCDSKIQWCSSSYFRILIFEHLHQFSTVYCMIFMTDVLNTQVCATRAVCILVPEWSLQWHNTRDRFLFPRILLVQNHKTICPTWATYSLLLSCV